MKKQALKDGLTWLLGLAFSAALMAILHRFFGLRYENSDDLIIAKAFLGFEGGQPIRFAIMLHPILGGLLLWLSRLFPGISFFSLYQLGLLLVSGAAMIAACTQIKGLKGALVGAVMLISASFVLCRISYTTTACFAGAAAVVLLASGLNGRMHPFRVALSVLLLCAGYMLRAKAAVPSLAFYLLVLFYHLVKEPKRLKEMLEIAAVFLLAVAVLFCLQTVVDHQTGMDGFAQWREAIVELFDYSDFEADPLPALEADSGLTENQVLLIREWYLWDAQIDASVLHKLAQMYPKEPLAHTFPNLLSFACSQMRVLPICGLLLLLLLWCLLSEDAHHAAAWSAALAVLGALALVLLLCYQGRVLFRAVDCALLPCATCLLALVLSVKAPKKTAMTAVLLAVLCLFAAHIWKLKGVLKETPDSVSQQREADLERFALSHPDKLIARTPNLLRDTRLFPDVSAGIPANTIIWGDWYCRLPGYETQMRSFGLDPASFALSDWTNPVLLFATNEEAPPSLLTDAIAEFIGSPVSAVLKGEEGTLRFFGFEVK